MIILRKCSAFLVLTLVMGGAAAHGELPVRVPTFPPRTMSPGSGLDPARIRNITGPDAEGRGLVIDLGDTTLFGRLYAGPYPFEAQDADIDYARYRLGGSIVKGRGVIPVSGLFATHRNANAWPEGQGWTMTPTVAYRMDLWRRGGRGPVPLGFFQGRVSFRMASGAPVPMPTIVDGPYLSLVRSDDPGRLVVSWRTDRPCSGMVTVTDAQGKESVYRTPASPSAHQEIHLAGLQPSTWYQYHVRCVDAAGDTTISNRWPFHTAPRAGEGPVVIAFAGDSRAGVGGGERSGSGVNARILTWMTQDAHHRGADLLLFAGDLVSGYTTEPGEFALQLDAWKQAVAGFWRIHPVYTGMGNHEALLNGFDDGSRFGLGMDKWPYDTHSTEVFFADMFHNPTNGPEPADPRRPPYRENVYTLRYGPVAIIAFNNNYWWTRNRRIPEYGGSPEGYIMQDQLVWILDSMEEAQADPAVSCILLFAQEPVFPCGGHVSDAMWWEGDNTVRAHVKDPVTGRIVPDGPGIIEVRNRLWEAVAAHDKVAAVLSADEHEYYRVLVDDSTPVGVYPDDDLDGDGKLDRASPNHRFRHPTWFITAGSAGAPYYNREETPWEPAVFTSQNGYVLLRASGGKVSLEFITETGQVWDQIEDLLAVKHP